MRRPRGGWSQAGGHTKGSDGSVEENDNRKRLGEIVGLEWKTFCSPLLRCGNDTVQGGRQDTETERHTDILSSTRSEREVTKEIVNRKTSTAMQLDRIGDGR